MSAKAQREMVDALDRWRDHPAAMVEELFDIKPDKWQVEVLEAFPHEPYVAMTACKGPGKTATISWLCWNYLLTRPHPNIAATSISGQNLKDTLWKEMAVWRSKSKLIESLFEWTSTRIFRRGHTATWFMAARTWPQTGDPQAQANTLAGLHQPYVMFVLDESGGIPDSVMVTAEAAMSGCIEGHIVQAGNPTSLSGPLYRAYKTAKNGPNAKPAPEGKWYLVEITGDPDDPMRSPRVPIDWAREQIRTYGRDNPWVMVNVFGQFPPGSINTLITEDEVRTAMRRFYRPETQGLVSRILGIDVAREGLDASVISRREGLQAHPFLRYRNVNGTQGGSIANRVWDEFKADAAFVDGTGGFGSSWIDALNNLGRAPISVHFASKPSDEERYVNKRAEMYFELVTWIKNGGALPPEESEGSHELLEALTKTQYFHKKDRLQLEEKEQLKDRLGFSPDEADALALTFAERVSPKVRSPFRSNAQSATAVYRPFADLDRGMGGAQSAVQSYNPYKSSY